MSSELNAPPVGRGYFNTRKKHLLTAAQLLLYSSIASTGINNPKLQGVNTLPQLKVEVAYSPVNINKFK